MGTCFSKLKVKFLISVCVVRLINVYVSGLLMYMYVLLKKVL